MNWGMIFECGPEGADEQVCTLLARRLVADIEITAVALGNKPRLIAGCGTAAANLLRDGCERVLIVWDLYPPWREEGDKPCRREDREDILQSLDRAGVRPADVRLVCIREELEAWLLADGRALSAVLSRPAHPVKIKGEKRPDRVANPKKRLMNLFRKHTGAPYVDLVHARRIVEAMPDLNHIERSESFLRFAQKVSEA
jgi:hypothetical protein